MLRLFSSKAVKSMGQMELKQGSHELVLSSILLVKICIYYAGTNISNQSDVLAVILFGQF